MVDVCGFLFRDTPIYSPPPELDAFLKAGPTPIYVGFGSIVVDDPEALIRIVLDAVELSGARAIVSKGWSDLKSADCPENIFFLGDCPHGKSFAQGKSHVLIPPKSGFSNRLQRWFTMGEQELLHAGWLMDARPLSYLSLGSMLFLAFSYPVVH